MLPHDPDDALRPDEATNPPQDPAAAKEEYATRQTTPPVPVDPEVTNSREPASVDPAATKYGELPSPSADPNETRYTPDAFDPNRTAYGPVAATTSRSRGKNLPRRFGNYELLEEIAHGGMGVVYLARQQNPHRLVALKMMLSGTLASRGALDRFYRECEAIAAFQHPGIVQIYESGEHEGQHFFSMAYVSGGSLHDWLAGGLPSPREAAQLMQQVAEAVQFAHEHGVIHRDIKPHNILLASGGRQHPEQASGGRQHPETLPQGANAPRSPLATSQPLSDASRPPLSRAIPRLTDFGLARTHGSDLSLTGEAMGTPSYMPPEQARGKKAEIGPAVDVYSLGAVLYCLLTGRPPFQSGDPYETMRQVCEDEPVPPRRLNAGVPPDLETVCLKCLEKNPQRRYASAAELAEELQRFQAGEPVQARPVGRLERGWRWCRRNPLVASLLAAVLLTLLLGTSVASAFAFKANTEAREAEKAREAEAERANAEATAKGDRQVALDQVQAEKRRTADALEQVKTQRDRAETALLKAETAVYAFRIRDAQLAYEKGDLEQTKTILYQCDPRFCRWEHDHLLSLTQKCLHTLPGHTRYVTSVSFSPDGKRLVSGSRDQTLKVWDAQSGQEVLSLKGHTREVSSVSFSPDGKRLVSGSHDKTLTIWDAKTGQKLRTLTGHTYFVLSVCWSGDGKCIVSGSWDETLKIWDAQSGQELLSLKGHTEPVTSVSWSADGKRIVSGSHDKTLKIWNAQTGQELLSLTGHSGSVYSVSWSADGKRIVSGSGQLDQSGELKIWDAQSGQELLSLKGHTDDVTSVSWSADGKRLVSGSRDQTLKM